MLPRPEVVGICPIVEDTNATDASIVTVLRAKPRKNVFFTSRFLPVNDRRTVRAGRHNPVHRYFKESHFNQNSFTAR
jgi:hypothetical protein